MRNSINKNHFKETRFKAHIKNWIYVKILNQNLVISENEFDGKIN